MFIDSVLFVILDLHIQNSVDSDKNSPSSHSNGATLEPRSILRRKSLSPENTLSPKPIKQRRVTWADGEKVTQKENLYELNPEQDDTSSKNSTAIPWYAGYFGSSKPVHLMAIDRRPSQSKK